MSLSLLEQEGNNQKIYGLDFMYQQIKELGDRLDEYNRKTGDPQESDSMFRGYIIEKKRKESFPLFKNDKIFISILDYDPESDTPLKLEVQTISPILAEINNNQFTEINFKLNSSDIEKYIEKTSKHLGYIEFAFENDYTINNENTIDNEKVSKKVHFKGGNEEIALLRSEILKLQAKNSNITTVKQRKLNNFIIICKDFSFTLNISPNHLVIEGKLGDVKKTEKIYPSIKNIITENIEIFGTKDTQEVQEETLGGIKKLFNFGKKTKDPSILEVGNKEIDELLQYIIAKTTYLNKFKSNLESELLDDLNFDDDIKDDIKNITIQLIENILSEIHEMSGDIDSKRVIYIGHLMNIFHNNITHGDLLVIYQYIINNEALEQKYGENIRKKILEKDDYKGNLSSILFSCGSIEYYDYEGETKHDMIFSEDNMQIITTTSTQELLSYNIVLGKEQFNDKIESLNKKVCKKISKDGRYVLTFKERSIFENSQYIHDLFKNKKWKLDSRLTTIYDRKYVIHNDFLISIRNDSRGDYNCLYTCNIKTGITKQIEMSVGINNYCINGDSIYFFESNKKGNFLNLNSYNLVSEEAKSLNYIVEMGERVGDIFSNNNQLFLLIRDNNDEIIIRSIDIKDDKVLSSSISDYNINGLKHVSKARHLHVSNDGYILLQSKNDIYIINRNTNLVYKYTPTEKINHLFKVHFVKNEKYGHFAICRDGNQIHKIDIGLIEKLAKPHNIDELNKGFKEEEEREEKEREEDIKKGKIIEIKETLEENREGLEKYTERALRKEMVAELRENRAVNLMILQEIKLLRLENQKLKETIKGVIDNKKE